MLLLSLASLLFAATVKTQQLALNEPPDGSIYLGAWVDTSDDSPLALNTRLGRNVSWFQFSQNIPVSPYDWTTGQGGIMNASLIFETGTDAGIYVTVYPSNGLGGISAQDWADLGVQLNSYTSSARSVFLRFAPEMNGNWDVWGSQPTLFLSTWRTMYLSLKTSCPTCAIVWSPNASPGYPYSLSPSQVPSAADRQALDTNGDGQFTAADDAFAPYYPGDAYVDWCGVSYYYKGVYPNSYNVPPEPGVLDASMSGYAPSWLQNALTGEYSATGVQYTPFYTTYCLTRPCMISESGAAWHVNSTSAPTSQPAVEQPWWRSGLTNTTFLAAYPRLKMLMMFEWSKVESDGGISTLRDFRVTNDSAVLQAFRGDLEGVQERIVWASEAGGVGQAAPSQVVLPLPSQVRATPYRMAVPTGLFYSGAERAAVGWATLGLGIVLGVAAVMC